MRLLLTADLQLGAGAGYGTPETPRLHDNAAALVKISELAAALDVDNIVVAGDVFQHRRPAIDELVVFRNWLETAPVEVLLVAGNHDVRGPDIPTTLALFGEEGLNVFTRPGLILPGIVAVPWAHPARMRQDGYGSDDVAEAIVRVARDLRADMRSDHNGRAALVTHFALSGMSTPTGFKTDDLREPVLDTWELAEAGFDYVLAGHVHKPEETTVGDATRCVSIGPPWRHDFGEATIEPNVVLLDTVTGELLRIGLEDRLFLTLELEATPNDDGVVQALGRPAPIRGAIVRVVVKVREDHAREVPVANIQRNLLELGAHRVFVRLDVERSVRARADVTDNSEPLAALDAWGASEGLDVTATGRLRALTEELLEAIR